MPEYSSNDYRASRAGPLIDQDPMKTKVGRFISALVDPVVPGAYGGYGPKIMAWGVVGVAGLVGYFILRKKKESKIMPVSNREMSEFMGAAYIPGTFPTVGVYSFMIRAGVKTSWGEVDRLWDAYYLALTEEKIPPYGRTVSGAVKAKLINSLSARTSLSKNTVAAWLNALVDEVEANGREYYLDPVTADEAAKGKVDPVNHPLETLKVLTKSAGDAAGNLLKPSADALTNVIKYAAIGLVSAALIYGIYQGVTLYKATKKRKRG